MTTLEIQRALIARGYDLGTGGPSGKGDDGDAGPLTLEALRAFQKSIGLPGSGIPGDKTFAALKQGQPAPIESQAAVPPWLRLAQADLGIVEGVGKSNNPKVLAMFADAGFAGIKDDAVAWCAAATGSWLKRAGIAPSGSLAARSYERWGVGLKEPALGAIATKKRGNSAWQGHVGLVVGASATQIFLLGGNQGDRVSVAAFPRKEFTSFRWPADVPLPAPHALPTTIAGTRSGVSEA